MSSAFCAAWSHQRVARRGEFAKGLHAAAAIGMSDLGGALVGLMDFNACQAAAERQP